MGKIIFLNDQAKQYHKERGIKVSSTPLKLVVSNSSQKRKPKRKTLGQRIVDKMNNPTDIA